MRALEEQAGGKQEKHANIQNALKEKEVQIQAEKEKAAMLQKMLDDLEHKQSLKKRSSIFNSNFNVEKEKEYRDGLLNNLKKTESVILDDTTEAMNEQEEDEQIIQAKVPQNVQNLKRQYEVL